MGNKPAIRVLAVDDHPVFRAGLIALVANEKDMCVVGEASNGREAVGRAEHLKPDVVIMDISMPEMNGLEATRIIHDVLPETKVLLLTLHSSSEFVRSAFRAGARGYVLKSDAENELVRALNVVIGEGTYVSPAVDARAAKESIFYNN